MIAIVGGGVAGLCLGYHLGRLGINYKILEKYTIGSTWSRQFVGFRLNTLACLSGLPEYPIPSALGSYPLGVKFAEYLRRWTVEHGIEIGEGVTVESLSRSENGSWQMLTSAGLLIARAVVLATGISGNPFIPSLGQEKFCGRCFHSSNVLEFSKFLGRRVLVVGSGNSAADMISGISDYATQTFLLMRSGINIVPRTSSCAGARLATLLLGSNTRRYTSKILNPFLTDYSAIGLVRPERTRMDIGFRAVPRPEVAERVISGHVIPILGSIEDFTRESVVLKNGKEFQIDDCVFCTGYRPHVNHLGISVEVSIRNDATLDFAVPTQKGVFALGFEYSSSEAWLSSINRIAQRAAAQICREIAMG